MKREKKMPQPSPQRNVGAWVALWLVVNLPGVVKASEPNSLEPLHPPHWYFTADDVRRALTALDGHPRDSSDPRLFPTDKMLDRLFPEMTPEQAETAFQYLQEAQKMLPPRFRQEMEEKLRQPDQLEKLRQANPELFRWAEEKARELANQSHGNLPTRPGSDARPSRQPNQPQPDPTRSFAPRFPPNENGLNNRAANQDTRNQNGDQNGDRRRPGRAPMTFDPKQWGKSLEQLMNERRQQPTEPRQRSARVNPENPLDRENPISIPNTPIPNPKEHSTRTEPSSGRFLDWFRSRSMQPPGNGETPQAKANDLAKRIAESLQQVGPFGESKALKNAISDLERGYSPDSGQTRNPWDWNRVENHFDDLRRSWQPNAKQVQPETGANNVDRDLKSLLNPDSWKPKDPSSSSVKNTTNPLSRIEAPKLSQSSPGPTEGIIKNFADGSSRFATWAAKTGERFSRWLPNAETFQKMRLPNVRMPQVSLPRLQAPRIGVPNFQGTSVLKSVALIALLGVMVACLILVAKTNVVGVQGNSRSWQFSQTRSEREQIQQLFEKAAVRTLGEKAIAENHRQLSAEIAGVARVPATTANSFADLYEQARYAPPSEPLDPNALAKARALFGDIEAKSSRHV